jgi:hypothetical protein
MGVVTTDITVGNHSFDKGRSISALHFRRFSLFVIQNPWKIWHGIRTGTYIERTSYSWSTL